MDVSLDRRHQHTTRFLLRAFGFFSFQVGQQVSHGLLHHASALDDLRQEHLPLSKQIPDDVHAIHQGAFDHCQGFFILNQGLGSVCLDMIHQPLDQTMSQTLLHTSLTPFSFFRLGFFLTLDRLRKLNEALGRIRSTIQQYVFDLLQ